PSKTLRCAVLTCFGDVEVESTIETAFRAAMATCENADLSITSLDWPTDAMGTLELRKVRRAIFALCEHRMWLEHGKHLARQPEDFDEPLRGMLEFGGKLNADKLSQYRELVADFAKRWHRCTSEFDVVLLPTSPVPAFAHALPTPDSLADLTVIATATGSPAATIPIPSRGLPAGLQIVGQAGTDELVMALAERLTRAERRSV
ncbi:MAG: amidase family protein, partial [Steroidobacteraceae bacterium]